MKKFYLLLILTYALNSCTSDSQSPNEPNSLLQRVDFNPGTLQEKRWLFNSEGLLFDITKADGTILQHFTYDSYGRLTSTENYYVGSPTEIHTWTYDNANFVTSASALGEVLTYDAASHTYTYGDINGYYSSFIINDDKLSTHSKSAHVVYDSNGIPSETIFAEMLVDYTNNNMTGYWKDNTCYSYSYDSNTNPLRFATLAISQAFSSYSHNPWMDVNSVSSNNMISRHSCPDTPESKVFQYTYNSDNLPTQQTTETYNSGVLQNSTVTIKYYYQGEVLP